MKAKLIALAAMAVSGAALAQSSVTVYGVADVWVGNIKSGEACPLRSDRGCYTSDLLQK